MPFQKYMHIWIICMSEIYAWIMHFYVCVTHNIPANISALFQRWLLVDMTSQRGTTSNQRWNNVLYFNVGIYNVEERGNIVVYFNVNVNNVRQSRNNVVLFNFEFHNVGQHGRNVVKMTISKKKTKKIISNWITEYTEFKILTAIS